MPGIVRVKVLVLDVEKELAGGAGVEIPGRMSFDQFLDYLCQKFPRFRLHFCPGGSLAPHARVFLDGRALTGPGGYVQPGSEVVFFPAIHGG